MAETRRTAQSAVPNNCIAGGAVSEYRFGRLVQGQAASNV